MARRRNSGGAQRRARVWVWAIAVPLIGLLLGAVGLLLFFGPAATEDEVDCGRAAHVIVRGGEVEGSAAHVRACRAVAEEDLVAGGVAGLAGTYLVARPFLSSRLGSRRRRRLAAMDASQSWSSPRHLADELAVAALALTAVGVPAFLAVPHHPIPIALACGVGAIALGLALDEWQRWPRITATDRGLVVRRPWRRTRLVRWDEVRSVHAESTGVELDLGEAGLLRHLERDPNLDRFDGVLGAARLARLVVADDGLVTVGIAATGAARAPTQEAEAVALSVAAAVARATGRSVDSVGADPPPVVLRHRAAARVRRAAWLGEWWPWLAWVTALGLLALVERAWG